MKIKLIILVLSGLIFASSALAHHSYAPYDIRNPIEISGVAEEFEFRRPHPILTMSDTEGVHWEIEVPLLFWTRAGYAEDEIKPGDELSVRGWPARNGRSEMALSGFTPQGGGYNSVLERIGQDFANEAADRIEAGEDLDSVLEDMPEAGTGFQGGPDARQNRGQQ